MKTPRPKTHWVVLWCDALGRPTRHHYARVDPIDQEDDFDALGRWQQSFEFIYRCALTGVARRYGIEAVRIRNRILSKKAPAPVQEEAAA
jgi:hypothetical protein